MTLTHGSAGNLAPGQAFPPSGVPSGSLFGDWFTAECKRLWPGMSWAKRAAAMQRNERQVRGWRKAKRGPEPATLQRLALLGFDTAALGIPARAAAPARTPAGGVDGPPAWGLVRDADAADPFAVPGADPDDLLVLREAKADVDAGVSARLAQLDAVLARETGSGGSVMGAPPDAGEWRARAAWFGRIRDRLAEWQATRADRYAPGGGPPRRPVPCAVLGGDYEHGTTWTLADAVLHLVAFDPAGLVAAWRALAAADDATRAQLHTALLWVWRVARPQTPERLLDVLDAFALGALSDAERRDLPVIGFAQRPRRALRLSVPREWHRSWGDDVHVSPCGSLTSARAALHVRTMSWRMGVAMRPAFTLAVVWLCTPIVMQRTGATPADWLALDYPALASAVPAVRAAAQDDTGARRARADVFHALAAWLPPPDQLRALVGGGAVA